MSSHVFHIVTWTESATAISMTLGAEGAIASLDDAERVAKALQQLVALKQSVGEYVRIGILSIPPPDPALTNHLPVVTDVEPILHAINVRILELTVAAGRARGIPDWDDK